MKKGDFNKMEEASEYYLKLSQTEGKYERRLIMNLVDELSLLFDDEKVYNSLTVVSSREYILKRLEEDSGQPWTITLFHSLMNCAVMCEITKEYWGVEVSFRAGIDLFSTTKFSGNDLVKRGLIRSFKYSDIKNKLSPQRKSRLMGHALLKHIGAQRLYRMTDKGRNLLAKVSKYQLEYMERLQYLKDIGRGV